MCWCAVKKLLTHSLTLTVFGIILCWYCTVLLFRLYAAQRLQWEVQTKGFDVICTGGVRSDDGGRRAAKRRRAEVISPGAPAKCVRAVRATYRGPLSTAASFTACVLFAGELQCLSHDVLLYTRAAYCVRPPVRYTYEFCQNGWTDQARAWPGELPRTVGPVIHGYF